MKTINKLILAFVTLILGAVLIGTVASTGLDVTSKSFSHNESLDFTTCRCEEGTINNTECNFTVTYYPDDWEEEDCPIDSVVVRNCTGDTLTITTDYLVSTDVGTVEIKNTSAVFCGLAGDHPLQNYTFIDYDYCEDSYLNSSFGRTSVDLIGGFFAIAILLISVGLFFSVAKDYGIF